MRFWKWLEKRTLLRGCLCVGFASLALGFAISYLSIFGSVRYVGYGFWSSCPGGYVAGSPLAFAEYDGEGVESDDTPSSLPRLISLGSSQTEFCAGAYIFNSVYWSLPAVPVFSLLWLFVWATKRSHQS